MNSQAISQQQADLLDEVYKAALDGSRVPVAPELDPAPGRVGLPCCRKPGCPCTYACFHRQAAGTTGRCCRPRAGTE